MTRIEHPEHPGSLLADEVADEVAEAAREAVREELREQTRGRRRAAALSAASGATALYAGAALAVALGLALAEGLPGWAAALLTAALLGTAARTLRGAARPRTPAATDHEAHLRDLHREDALRGPMPTGGPGAPHPSVTTPPPETTPDPRQRPI